MKKITTCLSLLMILIPLIGFSQNSSNKNITIRYRGDGIETPMKISGYVFSTLSSYNEFTLWGSHSKFFSNDSLFYVFVKQRIDSMQLCLDDDNKCRFPDVTQQIIVIDGEKYDILSSNGINAMEKNGRSVVFDKKLQDAINKAIQKYDRQLPPKERKPILEDYEDLLRKAMENVKSNGKNN